MKTAKLGDVCELDRKQVSFDAAVSEGRPFVGMENVSGEDGTIVIGDGSRTGDGKSTVFQFTTHHVLFGKLRPYLKKIAAPDFDGACSTELVPLRPDNGKLDRKFLFHWLRRDSLISHLMGKNTGARMPRADMNVLLAQEIPLPPLEEQLRIVALLDRTAEIRRRAEAARQKARSVIPALFADMFGDPATNPKCWPVAEFGEILESAQYGTSQKANETGQGVPVIRMGNVGTSGDLDTSDLKYVMLDGKEYDNAELCEGDILFNRTNSKELVGKTGIWDGRFEAVAASYFIRLRVDKSRVDPQYFWCFMNTPHMKQVLFNTARGAIGQSNINAKELKAFKLPVPSKELQDRFAAELCSIRALTYKCAKSADIASKTNAALLAEVFA